MVILRAAAVVVQRTEEVSPMQDQERRGEGKEKGEGASSKNEKLVVSCYTHSPLNFSMSSFSARVSFVEVDSDDAKEERSIRGGV